MSVVPNSDFKTRLCKNNFFEYLFGFSVRKVSFGFSLIELIIVILVLAIVSIIALPKFLNIQKDAQIAILENFSGSFKAVTDLVYAKAVLQNKDKQSNVSVSINNLNINTYFGAPQEIWNNALGELLNSDIYYTGNGYYDFNGGNTADTVVCTQASICVIDQTPSSTIKLGLAGWGMFFFPKGRSLADDCYAYYSFSQDGSKVTFKEIDTVIVGC